MGHGYVGDQRLHGTSDSREMSSSEGIYEMRAVVQRVSQASVKVEEQIVGAIGVIGPTRINYARIIPMVDYTAKVIGRIIG